MPYPVKVNARNKPPGWLSGLNKYIETPSTTEAAKDADATVRNHGGERGLVDKASYVGVGRTEKRGD